MLKPEIEINQILKITKHTHRTYQPFAFTDRPGVKIGTVINYHQEAIISENGKTYTLNLLTPEGRERLILLETKLNGDSNPDST